MDPYLEGALWPDVPLALAAEVRRRLVPLVGRRYAVRLAPTVVEDTEPGPEIGITYPMVPAVGVLARRPAVATPEEPGPGGAARRGAVMPVTLPILDAVEVHLPTVEIRDAVGDRLVTVIEILSPVNKRGQGLAKYRTKRVRLRRAGVHLLEIDLPRRGERPLSHPHVPASAYLVTLTRAGEATLTAWPIALADSLPEVLVPLRPPDEDVVLNLQVTLDSVYEAAAYDVSIDYAAPPPPPPLDPAEADWARRLMRARQV
jgi:hypothetical protein